MYPTYALHKELEQRLSEKNFKDLNDTLSFIREYMHNRLLFSESPELQAFMRSFDAAPTRSTASTAREPTSGHKAPVSYSSGWITPASLASAY